MQDFHAYLSIIENRLKSSAPVKEPDRLYQPIRYTLEGGGKRLRPVLLLAACEAVGGDADSAVNQAAAIEMFHNFTLLHDDVMDRADMRRGRATVHRRFDERRAILSGDTMLTMATQLLAEGCPDALLPRALRLFNATAIGIYEGQQLDLDFESRDDVTVDEYINMIRLKTSVLLGCACALGALMGGADDSRIRAFYRYGEALGLAFQLQDDLLDTYGDPIVFGKEIGGDIINDKKTWLRITAMAEDTSGIIAAETEHPSEPAEKIARVTGVYDSLGLAGRCRELVERYVNDAIACLDSIA
ncbi:MAG: polyprenyl synthetase family protein, partial [Paramuribaculum sp.]|nr:polyprenyl synthetase family protein [Paramuribaculum sp.]